jgi:hypothetical protein
LRKNVVFIYGKQAIIYLIEHNIKCCMKLSQFREYISATYKPILTTKVTDNGKSVYYTVIDIIRYIKKYCSYSKEVFIRCDPSDYGLFKGWNYIYTKNRELINVYLEHLHTIFPNDEEYEFLLKVLFFPIKHPGKRSEVITFISGAQGSGKSTIMYPILRAVGEFGVLADFTEFKKEFNSTLYGAVYVVDEEVSSEGFDKKLSNEFKRIATAMHIIINDKFAPRRIVQNVCNYFGFSNHMNALYIEPDDRRHFILRTDDCLVNNEKYFNRLYSILNENEIEFNNQLFSYVQDMEIPDKPLHPPMTTEKQNLLQNGSCDCVKEFIQQHPAEFINGWKYRMLSQDEEKQLHSVWFRPKDGLLNKCLLDKYCMKDVINANLDKYCHKATIYRIDEHSAKIYNININFELYKSFEINESEEDDEVKKKLFQKTKEKLDKLYDNLKIKMSLKSVVHNYRLKEYEILQDKRFIINEGIVRKNLIVPN